MFTRRVVIYIQCGQDISLDLSVLSTATAVMVTVDFVTDLIFSDIRRYSFHHKGLFLRKEEENKFNEGLMSLLN